MALGASILLARAATAQARAGGIVTDTCQSCHSGGDGPPTLSLSAEPATFNPGELVNFTLIVRSASMKVAGAFITSGGLGTLRSIAGEGLQSNGQGLTHIAPKAAVGGAVTFRFAWQAPAKPGGVDFRVAALAANGNNSPTGDAPGSAEFQWAFGCPAQTFYLDLDRDGYGSKSFGTLLGCVGDPAPIGFAAASGDCDENDEKVHPGAKEICNRKDDNCDAQIDEGSAPVTMWPDLDGDGYYGSQVGTSKIGCGDVSGYAAEPGDCDDADPRIHPSAVEICNLRDDDCDGDVDERVRPRCGLGWCARESNSCSPDDCRPGPPASETCNAFDDDCDGEIDNDSCASGFTCAGYACVPRAEPSANAGGGSTAGAGGALGVGGSTMTANAGAQHEAAPQSGCAVAVFRRPRAGRGRCETGLSVTIVALGCLAYSLRRGRRRKK